MKRILIIGFVLASSSLFAAQEENFNAWNLLCGDQGNCSLSQLVAKDPQGKKVLMGVNVNFSISTQFPVMILRLPPAIYQEGGVGLKVDDNKSIQVPMSQCTNAACQSVIKIDETLLKEMHEGKMIKVAFALKKEQQMTLPVSLNGFKKGFRKLVGKMHEQVKESS